MTINLEERVRERIQEIESRKDSDNYVDRAQEFLLGAFPIMFLGDREYGLAILQKGIRVSEEGNHEKLSSYERLLLSKTTHSLRWAVERARAGELPRKEDEEKVRGIKIFPENFPYHVDHYFIFLQNAEEIERNAKEFSVSGNFDYRVNTHLGGHPDIFIGLTEPETYAWSEEWYSSLPKELLSELARESKEVLDHCGKMRIATTPSERIHNSISFYRKGAEVLKKLANHYWEQGTHNTP
ncbi:MAG TPA: hypothetical protein VJB94_00705 [Candidatus Nanoarchaeia archaeon]|nr:hypothetical protein [Candidatus Nanoarchaeia archaeon]